MKTNNKMITRYRPIGADSVSFSSTGEMLGYGLMFSIWFNM